MKNARQAARCLARHPAQQLRGHPRVPERGVRISRPLPGHRLVERFQLVRRPAQLRSARAHGAHAEHVRQRQPGAERLLSECCPWKTGQLVRESTHSISVNPYQVLNTAQWNFTPHNYDRGGSARGVYAKLSLSWWFQWAKLLNANKPTGKTKHMGRRCPMRMVPIAAGRSSKVLIALAGCATLLSAVLPGTAMAATRPSVTPLNGSSCDPYIIGAQECTAVVGSGLKITSISGTFNNNGPSEDYGVSVEFYGPNGYITRTATYNVPKYSSIGPFVWHNPNPNATMPAGDYCTEAEGHSDCIDVHS
jgi:hypothetical protein